MEANLSPETLVDAAVNTAANGGGTVEESVIKLADLNKQLGADFKDASAALKAVKETKDFVGKRREDYINEMKQSVVSAPDVASKADVQALKDELFYSQNPQYKDMRPVISKIGGDPSTVVNSDEFKPLFEKVKVADEVAQAKSVVQSNSRVSQSPAPVMEEAVRVANARGSTLEDVATIFAQAINKENEAQR